MANILIVDDNSALCDLLCRQLERIGHHAANALTIEDGLRKVASQNFDVVYLDVNLPDGSGLEALPQIVKAASTPEVIIITAEGDPDGAELAIQSGAWDYIEKPVSLKEMMLPLARALQYRNEKKRQKPLAALKRENILGNSPQLQKCLDLLAEAAGSEENVLITGETGTGKELFAKAIHENSERSEKDFVVVDCTALPDTLVDSILFGHEKGAFTGANKTHTGLFKQADGGILFLDEIGELPLAIQKSFLRVLQERRFRPLGSQHELESNFRLLAATNKNLDKMVADGRFRKDLLFRLKSLVIHLPPLKDRSGDIKEITIHFIRKLSEKSGEHIKGFAPEFFEALQHYSWPGNVRELLSTLDRAVVASKGEPTLFPKHLPTHIRVHLARTAVQRNETAEFDPGSLAEPPEILLPLKAYRESAVMELEREYFQKLLSLTRRDIQKACRISGLSRSRLYHLIKKYKIDAS